MNSKTILGISLGAIFVFAMISNPAFAAIGKDPKGDVSNGDPNFDIKKFGISNAPYVDVYGKAGDTTVNDGDTIYAYVFVTDAGIFAVTSHGGIEDSTEVGDDEQFHGHLVTLDANNCLTGVFENGIAALQNKRVSILGTGATTVFAVLTAQLNVSAGGCVTVVFDSA